VHRRDCGESQVAAFHTLALDGVYVREAGSAEQRFVALAAPTVEQVHEVAMRTEVRVRDRLCKSGVNVHAVVGVDGRPRIPESGFLGVEAIGITSMVQYWRSLDQLMAYARERNAVHFPAWVEFTQPAAHAR
jgi:hypothetical protein